MLTGCSEDDFGVVCGDSDRCPFICPLASANTDTNETRLTHEGIKDVSFYS